MTTLDALPRATLFALCALCALAAGCKKREPGFAGTYDGTATTTMTMGAPVNETNTDRDQDSVQIADLSPTAVRITMDEGEDGSPPCVLNARREGLVATITPGQSCVSHEGNDTMTLTVTSGRATLAGRQLTLQLNMALAMTAEGTTVSGTVTENFTGTRP